MKKNISRLLAIAAGLVLLCAAASADSLTLNGTVTAGEAVMVYAPIGGTVGEVFAEAGQQVSADDVLYAMKTSKTYAEGDGTVTGIFGQPGDSAAAVSSRYGAVLYLEGTSVFSVSASTENAYNSTETKFVHVGEKVYLQCRSNSARTGTGVITAISGTGYTVEVNSGTFIPGDSVEIYRASSFVNTSKIGRGTVNRTNPTGITGNGAIVSIPVEDGAQVKRGDLLLETLDGDFDGYYMSGTEIRAGTAGVIGSLAVKRGNSIQKDAVAAEIYTLEGMRVEASVPEDSRSQIRKGDKVTIELEADESRTYQGVVTMVSAIAEEAANKEGGSSEVTYKVLIDFTPDDEVRFGMSVIVTTLEAEEAPAAAAEAQAEEETAEEETAGE